MHSSHHQIGLPVVMGHAAPHFRPISIYKNSYLAPRLVGIKQKKYISHCWASRWFLEEPAFCQVSLKNKHKFRLFRLLNRFLLSEGKKKYSVTKSIQWYSAYSSLQKTSIPLHCSWSDKGRMSPESILNIDLLFAQVYRIIFIEF